MTNPLLQDKLSKIQLVVFDVDGVLTDGKIYYFGNEVISEIKAFHIHDGLGIKLLHDHNIRTAILTGRKSEIVKHRAAELGIQVVVQNSQNKLKDLKTLVAKHFPKLAFDCIGYMGDDVQDLVAMQQVGICFAPNNAHHKIKSYATYVTRLNGGEGAVREVCDLIVNSQSN